MDSDGNASRTLSDQARGSIPDFFRQIASDWEAGHINADSLPSMVRPKHLPDAVSELAVCLIHVSRWSQYLHSRKLLEKLSPREREVLKLVVAGRAAKNIAFELDLSQRTVENHISSIFKKTSTRKLAELLKVVYQGMYFSGSDDM